MRRAAVAAIALAACRASVTVATGETRAAAVTPAAADAVSVTAFGAKGDGTTDDRDAIQAALDAAARGKHAVYLPRGTYLVSPSRRGYWSLDVPSGVRLFGDGDGSVLQLACKAGPAVRLLHASGDDIVIDDLALDGNAGCQEKNKQRHGLFATNTNRLRVERVLAHDFTGDGFYLFNGARGSTFFDVRGVDNHRNGLTLGGNIDGTRIVSSTFTGNHAQQLDSEPVGGLLTDTTVFDCTIDGAGVSNDYALTVSGGEHVPGRGWKIVGNRIGGGTFMVWVSDVAFLGNTAVNTTPRAAVTVYRSSSRVQIAGNRIDQATTGTRSLAAVLVQGTGTHSAPADVMVLHNELTTRDEQAFGIRIEGAISVSVVDNELRGAGVAAPGYAGVYVRATNAAEDFESAVIRDNRIRDFGSFGVSVQGNGDARLRSVVVEGNTFEDDGASPAMTTAISLDDGSGAAQQVSVDRNQYRAGISVHVAHVPARARIVGREIAP